MTASAAELDEQFMRRAIRLAMNGRGRVEPNPMVGCVLVKAGRVIGEGYHRRFGGPHAEPAALAACTESPDGATAYVTLEPCCHFRKKTPPCVPRLLEAGVARVAAGCVDPNPEVDGKGLALLREAGVEVTAPVLGAEANQLIAPFIARTRFGRPYVTLKWAQTADGKVAGAGGRPVQIGNATSRKLVHELRSRCDGIIVGVNTVLTDDPLLNARYAAAPSHPHRFVLDRDLRIPAGARVLTDRGAATTIFYGYEPDVAVRRRPAAAFDDDRVNTVPTPVEADGRLSLSHVLRRVAGASCFDVLVEPGPTLAASFLAGNFADRVWVFRSPLRMDEPTAPAAAAVPDHYVKTGEVDLDGDTLSEYLNPGGPNFFAGVPSADFVLAGG